jgi:hypothetical protein
MDKRTDRTATRRALSRITLAAATVVAVATLGPASVLADSSASQLPPSWHVHDGQVALGPQHKGIGFFPAILGVSVATYVEDPAECPNATDKAFLPSFGSASAPLLRAGMCQTSAYVIQLRTIPDGVDGPEGWASLTAASEPGWRTFYSLTPR